MNLYLVQHAEAKRKEEDPDRPLSEKGWADIRKVAAYIADHIDIKVSAITHSRKTRARQTAEALAEYLKPPKGIQEAEGLEPLAEPSVWADRLAGIKEDTMLVGHLPHLVKLSAYLLSHDENKKILNFSMGGIVCLGRDESGDWSVRWMIIPEILK
ncbi:MAG: phosphohistidine phosphatase SixA [Deltaproteobacteria bacterium]|nr:MAG: phosphohistidine phosphatase SixA [Deltaproteobacteria bacterium]